MGSKREKQVDVERRLLDFGCLWDTLQILLEHQDFGVFLLQNSDQVVQQSDVSANREAEWTNAQYILFDCSEWLFLL